MPAAACTYASPIQTEAFLFTLHFKSQSLVGNYYIGVATYALITCSPHIKAPPEMKPLFNKYVLIKNSNISYITPRISY